MLGESLTCRIRLTGYSMHVCITPSVGRVRAGHAALSAWCTTAHGVLLLAPGDIYFLLELQADPGLLLAQSNAMVVVVPL